MVARKAWVLSGALGALVLAAGGFLALRAAAPSVAPAAAQASTPSAGESWPEGRRCVHTLTFSATVGGALPLLDLGIQGTLSLVRVTGGDGKAILLEGELQPSSVALKTAPESESALRERLAQTFVLRVAPGGRFVGIAFPEAKPDDAVDQTARGVLQTLAAALQVTHEGGGGDAWSSIETDMTGRYRAKYTKVTAGEYAKRKTEYVAFSHGVDAGAKTLVDSSAVSLRFDGAFGLHNLERLTLTERTHTEGAGTFPRVDSAMTLEVTRTTVDQSARALAEHLAFSPLDDLSRSQVVQSARAEELADQTWQGLASEVERLEAAGDTGKRARAYSNLAAALRFRPASVAEAKKEILANPKSRYLLIHALGDAGSIEAQAALRDLFRSLARDEPNQKNVVYALSMLETPTAETTGFLESLMDDTTHAVQARYGVGTSAYYARETQPELAAAAVETLAQRLQGATDAREVETYLRALGNSAHPTTLSHVEPYLTDERTAVRSAAVDALRRVPGSRVDAAIARALTSDEAERVRKSAASTLDYRSPTPALVYSVRSAALSESSESIRLHLVSQAARWLDEAPVLADTLRQLAANDASEKVRKAATDGLKKAR